MKKILIIILLAAGMFSMNACKKDFLTSLASNPNTPSASVATPQLVLPAALTNTSSVIQTDFPFLAVWFGTLNWKGGYQINAPSLTYVLTTTGNNDCWNDMYYNASNYAFIEQAATTEKNEDNYVAISIIMQAVDFEYLVDNFNNVPYTDALNGQAGNTNAFFPKYDKAEDVYTNIVDKLDSAINIIQTAKGKTTEIVPGKEDIMFGGNMDLWASFANTVKLRMLLQQSEMPGRSAYISGEISKTSSIPYLGPGQNAFVQPKYANQMGPNGGNQENPFYYDFGFDQNGNPHLLYPEQGAGQAALDFLNKTNDAVRRGLFYTTVPGTEKYEGDYYGLLPTYSISNIGSGLLQAPTQPSIVLSACESLFMQSEAALRGWIPGGNAMAEKYYDEAITESFAYLMKDYLGYSPGDIIAPSGDAITKATAYYSQKGLRDVSWSTNYNQDLRSIIMQKWIALNANTPMAYWNDYRRFQDIKNPDGTTGLPDVPLSKYSTFNGTVMPFRVYYPQDEYNKNAANVPAAASTGPTSKIFWMP